MDAKNCQKQKHCVCIVKAVTCIGQPVTLILEWNFGQSAVIPNLTHKTVCCWNCYSVINQPHHNSETH
eukprot:2001525-Amphidinium_carterae.1